MSKTNRAKTAAEITAQALRAQGFRNVDPTQVWENGKEGLKPRLRIGTWKILREQYGMSLPQIAREATPINPKTGKRFDHTTVLSGIRRFNHYFGELA